MYRALLILGSNLSERETLLKKAAEILAALPETTLNAMTGFYETAPVGMPPDTPDFLNAGVMIETGLSPRALLGACLGIEAALGRRRGYGRRSTDTGARSRPIDIDIWEIQDKETAAAVRSNDEELTLPHPRMNSRDFAITIRRALPWEEPA